jgi:S1-C subfamily serine protease
MGFTIGFGLELNPYSFDRQKIEKLKPKDFSSLRRRYDSLDFPSWQRDIFLKSLAGFIVGHCNADYYKKDDSVARCMEEASSATPREDRGPSSRDEVRASQGREQRDWPAWRAPTTPRPPHAFPSPVATSELFRVLSPSVYLVKASRARGKELEVSQGSAVAISTNEAITNCHVVGGASTVTLSKGPTTLEARISAADEPTDRCYLAVLSGTLEPIIGLRDHSKLSVGETVYTIGSPRGLDNTLGQGLISGLRKVKGVQFIQITAPISPGSSGGGLFDERGNLIGITTFAFRDSQNLNFAIAASEYWR